MRTIRTPVKRKKFLDSLVETGGNVSRSCLCAGVSKVAAYAWRNDDRDFATEWDEAVETGTEAMEEEARRRAYRGVDKPVFYQGEECGTIREYSDTLMIFLLKARKPDKYREKIQLSVPDLDAAIERQLERLATRSQTEASGETDSESIH